MNQAVFKAWVEQDGTFSIQFPCNSGDRTYGFNAEQIIALHRVLDVILTRIPEEEIESAYSRLNEIRKDAH